MDGWYTYLILGCLIPLLGDASRRGRLGIFLCFCDCIRHFCASYSFSKIVKRLTPCFPYETIDLFFHCVLRDTV